MPYLGPMGGSALGRPGQACGSLLCAPTRLLTQGVAEQPGSCDLTTGVFSQAVLSSQKSSLVTLHLGWVGPQEAAQE